MQEHPESDFIGDTAANYLRKFGTKDADKTYKSGPSESYLVFEGRLTKADGTAYANGDNVTLTNNALMHLFSKYQFSGQEIESLYSMLRLLKYPDDFSKSQGLNQLWYKYTGANTGNSNIGFTIRQAYIIRSPDPKSTFSFRVPLKHIFGFCEDYNKIVYGMKCE